MGHKKYQVAESSLKPVGKIVQSFILSKVQLDQISRLTTKKPYQYLWPESARISVKALLDGLLPLPLVVEVVVAVGAVAVEAELAIRKAVTVPIGS